MYVGSIVATSIVRYREIQIRALVGVWQLGAEIAVNGILMYFFSSVICNLYTTFDKTSPRRGRVTNYSFHEKI